MELENKLGVELTNEKQENALGRLRASIQAQREQRSAVFQSELPLPPRMELWEVPEVTIKGVCEFNLNRYEELCGRVNSLYHNYLYWKIELKDKSSILERVAVIDTFEEALKDLTECVEETIEEGLKVRFS